MTKSVESDTQIQIITRKVLLKGIRELMFDRYAGDNNTKLTWDQKLYLVPGTSKLAIPTTNIVSFLSAHNTNSAPKRLRDKRKYKDICNACLSFVSIRGTGDDPRYIEIMRDNETIKVGKFQDDYEPDSKLYLHRSVARLDKGIPNPKERPVLPLPWAIEFELDIMPNKEIKEQEIYNLFVEGGLAIGLGTFRGVYGKFLVEKWE